MRFSRTGSAIEHGSRWGVLVLGALLTLPGTGLGQAKPGSQPEPIDSWRAEAARVRHLADNDAPAAYRDAQRLQATLPTRASPADRARALNLLSRLETYLGLTEPAATHAREAFELAATNGDRVGQAESDLNVALNSINQGRLDEMVTATRTVSRSSKG